MSKQMCSYFSTSNPISRYIEDLRSLGCSYEASPTGGGGGALLGPLAWYHSDFLGLVLCRRSVREKTVNTN